MGGWGPGHAHLLGESSMARDAMDAVPLMLLECQWQVSTAHWSAGPVREQVGSGWPSDQSLRGGQLRPVENGWEWRRWQGEDRIHLCTFIMKKKLRLFPQSGGTGLTCSLQCSLFNRLREQRSLPEPRSQRVLAEILGMTALAVCISCSLLD